MSEDNKLEEQHDSQQQSELDTRILRDFYTILLNLKETMNQSKQLLNLELIKINDVYNYINNSSHKQNLIRHYTDLVEASNNVNFFYKFMEENVDRKIDATNKILEIQNICLQQQENSNQRGPYKNYTPQMKKEAIDRVLKGEQMKDVCDDMDIPRKNIRRWIQQGAERRKGGGRKTIDTEMEQKLHQWCINESIRIQKPISRLDIRKQALKFTKYPTKFKASKGWTDKFVRKFNLRKKIIKYSHYNNPNIRKLEEKGFYKQRKTKKCTRQGSNDPESNEIKSEEKSIKLEEEN